MNHRSRFRCQIQAIALIDWIFDLISAVVVDWLDSFVQRSAAYCFLASNYFDFDWRADRWIRSHTQSYYHSFVRSQVMRCCCCRVLANWRTRNRSTICVCSRSSTNSGWMRTVKMAINFVWPWIYHPHPIRNIGHLHLNYRHCWTLCYFLSAKSAVYYWLYDDALSVVSVAKACCVQWKRRWLEMCWFMIKLCVCSFLFTWQSMPSYHTECPQYRTNLV